MRGEHDDRGNGVRADRGSSPRARGALFGRSDLQRSGRIIPACAGSTAALERRSHSTGDHPRVRGEHAKQGCRVAPYWGSSPRARGAQRVPLLFGVRPGIIPACAGSTKQACSDSHRNRDHPRVRGEHTRSMLSRLGQQGSSPRARGAHRHYRYRLARLVDHPRVRGEHGNRSANRPSDRGSSPRARGAPDQGRGRLVGRGIIPACAGSTGDQFP